MIDDLFCISVAECLSLSLPLTLCLSASLRCVTLCLGQGLYGSRIHSNKRMRERKCRTNRFALNEKATMRYRFLCVNVTAKKMMVAVPHQVFSHLLKCSGVIIIMIARKSETNEKRTMTPLSVVVLIAPKTKKKVRAEPTFACKFLIEVVRSKRCGALVIGIPLTNSRYHENYPFLNQHF